MDPQDARYAATGHPWYSDNRRGAGKVPLVTSRTPVNRGFTGGAYTASVVSPKSVTMVGCGPGGCGPGGCKCRH